MAGFFSIDKKEEQSDISNIDNYELNLDADEIAKKTFKTMLKQTLELCSKLLEGKEEDYEKKFVSLTKEIFEERLKCLEKFLK